MSAPNDPEDQPRNPWTAPGGSPSDSPTSSDSGANPFEVPPAPAPSPTAPGYQGQPHVQGQSWQGNQSPYPPPGYAPGYAPQFTWAQMKPGIVPIRPLMFSDVMGGMFRLIRFNPKSTIGLAFLVTLLGSLLVLPIAALASRNMSMYLDPDFELAAPTWILTAVPGIIASLVLLGPFTIVTIGAVQGRQISPSEMWRDLKPQLKNYVLTVLLLSLFGLIPFVALIVFALASDYLDVSWGFAFLIGFVLLIGGLIAYAVISIRFMFAVPATVVESLSPITALKRSWGLSRRAFFRILGYYIVLNIVIQFVVAVFSIPITMITVFAVAMLSTSAAFIGGATMLASTVAGALALVFTLPLQSGFMSLMYIDQRIRKEGFDIELMSDIAPPTQPPTQ